MDGGSLRSQKLYSRISAFTLKNQVAYSASLLFDVDVLELFQPQMTHLIPAVIGRENKCNITTNQYTHTQACNA